MERLFFRESIKQSYGKTEEGVMVDMQKLVVGVTGIGRGAGATFTAMGLAFRLGEMTSGVTYLEGQGHGSGCVSPYGLLAVDREFRRAAERDRRLTIYKKVNWQFQRCHDAVPDGGGTPDYRLPHGKVIIVDNPISFEEIDIAVAVVDPFPPRILAGLETFKELKETDLPGAAGQNKVLWLINKSDGSTARRRTEKFLKLKFDFEQPLLSSDIFYKAAYSCSQPYFICKTEGIDGLALKILESI